VVFYFFGAGKKNEYSCAEEEYSSGHKQ